MWNIKRGACVTAILRKWLEAQMEFFYRAIPDEGKEDKGKID